MTELELQQYLLREYPQENARCEWKEFKNLKNSFCGDEKDEERGLVKGEYPYLTISLSIARQTKQLPEYTKVKGLERDKIKQMALQFIQNAGEEGTKLDAILEYIKDVLPSTKSMEQKRRLLRHILEEMKKENMILVNGRTWFENGYKS